MNSQEVPRYNLHARQEMAELVLGCPKRVLEIGCGAGRFRTNLNGEVEYWGVEPNHCAVEQARQLLTHAMEGFYEDVSKDIPEHYFDLIVCNDVIEHTRDPRGFLRDLLSKIANDGSMIVSIPNLRNALTLFDLLIKGDFQYVDSGVLDYTHLHLFTKKSFMRMAEQCGWSVELCRPMHPQPFKPFKNIVLSCIKLFIPEIKCIQLAARLRPQAFRESKLNLSDSGAVPN